MLLYPDAWASTFDVGPLATCLCPLNAGTGDLVRGPNLITLPHPFAASLLLPARKSLSSEGWATMTEHPTPQPPQPQLQARPPPPVEISPSLTLQAPLSRRGHGPGLVLVVDHYAALAEGESLDPPPLQKWAEEGFAVAQIKVPGKVEDGGEFPLDRAVEALRGLEGCTGVDEKGIGLVCMSSFGLTGREKRRLNWTGSWRCRDPGSKARDGRRMTKSCQRNFASHRAQSWLFFFSELKHGIP